MLHHTTRSISQFRLKFAKQSSSDLEVLGTVCENATHTSRLLFAIVWRGARGLNRSEAMQSRSRASSVAKIGSSGRLFVYPPSHSTRPPDFTGGKAGRIAVLARMCSARIVSRGGVDVDLLPGLDIDATDRQARVARVQALEVDEAVQGLSRGSNRGYVA
jgi:hypothetical protein